MYAFTGTPLALRVSTRGAVPRQTWHSNRDRSYRSLRRPQYARVVVQCKAQDGTAASPTPSVDTATAPVRRVFDSYIWRGYTINYLVEGPADGPPVLLVHGFGASVQHWRKNIPALVEAGNRVFVLDLLGFGASDKPDLGIGGYSLELWSELCVDFINDIGSDAKGKFAFVGNSIGSLVSLITALELGADRVRGLCLVNCAGGMVSFRYSELNPFAAVLLWLFNTILFNRFTGPSFFERFATRENVENVAKQAYAGGALAVDDDLLEILLEPGQDEGAAKVFLAVVNGPPGPSPEELLSQLDWCPILALWGADDPFTPFERGLHPGAKFPEYNAGLVVKNLGNYGHCPHDAAPELVNPIVCEFLKDPPALSAVSTSGLKSDDAER